MCYLDTIRRTFAEDYFHMRHGCFDHILFSFICLVSVLALQNQANFEIVEGKRVVNVTKTIQSVSQISCVASCLSLAGHGECKVADYHSGARECHLSNQMLSTTVENAMDKWKLLIITGMQGIHVDIFLFCEAMYCLFATVYKTFEVIVETLCVLIKKTREYNVNFIYHLYCCQNM